MTDDIGNVALVLTVLLIALAFVGLAWVTSAPPKASEVRIATFIENLGCLFGSAIMIGIVGCILMMAGPR